MTDRFERFSYAMLGIYRAWHKLTAEEMEKWDLKGTHAVYLLAMGRHPEGITAPQLCTLCGRDKADVSRMISIMEQRGLVIKTGAYKSLYRGSFTLTEEGKKAAEFVRQRASLAVELAGKDMTEPEREIFYAGLESIMNNLKELSEKGIPTV